MLQIIFTILSLIFMSLGITGFFPGLWNLAVFFTWAMFIILLAIWQTKDKLAISKSTSTTCIGLMFAMSLFYAWFGYIVLGIVWVLSTVIHIIIVHNQDK